MLPPPPTSGRILLVDDDDRQRTALAAILADRGFETQVAADGLEALERLTFNAARFCRPGKPLGDTAVFLTNLNAPLTWQRNPARLSN